MVGRPVEAAPPAEPDRECTPEMFSKLREGVGGAKHRARKYGREIEDDLLAFTLRLFRAQGGRCALTGIPFDLRIVGCGKARRPFAPSLDRIDASGGYTRDNVRLVCQAVNFALNSFGEDVFREMAKAAAQFDPATIRPIPAADRETATDAASADQSEVKRRYIAHVIAQAPRILARHGGILEKAAMREALRQSYDGEIPLDEANAYGWGFRRLTEAGAIEPASGTDVYRLAKRAR